MLIGQNIKNILGGGYNVSEVKYMDKTVWKKSEEVQCSFILSDDGLSKRFNGTITINNIIVSSNKATKIESKDSMFLMRVKFDILYDAIELRINVNGINFFDHLYGRKYDYTFKLSKDEVSKKQNNIITINIT